MDSLKNPEHHSDSDLDAQIMAAEKLVIERDDRIRRRAHEVVEHVRSRTGSSLVVGVGLAGGAFVLSRLLRRGRPGRATSHGSASPPGILSRLIGLAAVIWPLLPVGLRSRLPPGAAPLLAALGLPLLTDVRRAPGPLQPPVVTAPRVDLSRYAGRWFEIAQIPGGRPHCSGQASAVYSLEAEGISVLNRCIRRGHEIVAQGIAKVVEGGNGAKLQVCFAPKWLRWLPLVWHDYWILHVDAGYRHALVGTPDRRHLWLLARTPHMASADSQHLIDRARAQGYLVDRLKFTPQ